MRACCASWPPSEATPRMSLLRHGTLSTKTCLCPAATMVVCATGLSPAPTGPRQALSLASTWCKFFNTSGATIRCSFGPIGQGAKKIKKCRMTLLRFLKRHPALTHECDLQQRSDQQKSPWSSFDCIEEEQGSRQLKVPVLSYSGRGQGRARGVSAEHGVASGGASAGDRWRRHDD
jgi:hypothetical protein